MNLLLFASITDKVVEPIVDVATEFIGSAGVVAVFVLNLVLVAILVGAIYLMAKRRRGGEPLEAD